MSGEFCGVASCVVSCEMSYVVHCLMSRLVIYNCAHVMYRI